MSAREGTKKESIESFLGLYELEINKRIDEVKRTIPTIPGINYIKTRLKVFSVQPWPFITYLAYYSPNELKDSIDSYRCYDGAENANAIIEQLKEYYILIRTLEDLSQRYPNYPK